MKVKLRDLTEEQYKDWLKRYCDTGKGMCESCFSCIFDSVFCNERHQNCWIYNKSLQDEKFLDREIEVEE